MLAYNSAHFPRSGPYHALSYSAPSCVRDTDRPLSFPWTERHLRCVWSDFLHKPLSLTSMDGRSVYVVNPGRWNLEAGPDFLDAILKTGPDEFIMRGDIEIHIRPIDWRHHGHAADPRYSNVIAHITYFDGVLPASDMPSSVLQIPLRGPLNALPAFSFDGLDLLAYPCGALSSLPPCATILKTWTPEQRGHLLDSAGEERMRLKTERLTKSVIEKGRDQALYEEFMCALGYKHNRRPFAQLAQTLPLARLRQDSDNVPLQAYSLLLGVAGLLPTKSNPLWDTETRIFIRELWDIWWKHQSMWHDNIVTLGAWTLSNLRPANHPLRRLMAAAHIFTGENALLTRISTPQKSSLILWNSLLRDLQSAGEHSYWAWRGSFSKPRHCSPEALIGPGRAASILNNVLIPWLAATNSSPTDSLLLAVLPSEDENRLIKHTAHALFGHDHTPALYHSGLRQQGLLQIFHDFCLNSRNGCGACHLPNALAHQKI
ncbi:MAG: DUF2851 family protein [bacterium]